MKTDLEYYETTNKNTIIKILETLKRGSNLNWIGFRKDGITQDVFNDIIDELYRNGYIYGDVHEREDIFKGDLENIRITQKGRDYSKKLKNT